MMSSFEIPGLGTFWTTEEDTASATDPAAALDRIGRMAYVDFHCIHAEIWLDLDKYGESVQGQDVVQRQAALLEMVETTGIAWRGRRGWGRYKAVELLIPPWSASIPTINVVDATPVGEATVVASSYPPATKSREAA